MPVPLHQSLRHAPGHDRVVLRRPRPPHLVRHPDRTLCVREEQDGRPRYRCQH